MTERLRCAYATDRGFAMQTAASIASLVAHAPRSDLEIVVLHDDLPVGLQQRIRTAGGQVPLDFRSVSTVDLDGIELPYYLAMPTLFRLLLPDLVPEWSDVLYLDADTIVTADPTKLWSRRAGNALASGAIDPGLPRFGYPGGPPWGPLGIAPTEPYFNAGVLLVDLDGWRAEEIGRRALAVLREHRLPHGDQCALNAVLLGRIDRIDGRWNVTPPYFATHSALMAEEGLTAVDSVRRAARVLHFSTSGFGRPWLDGCTHPCRDEWYSAVDRTPWAGFRPRPRTLLRRGLGAARRALRLR